jgi:hypothetical protein
MRLAGETAKEINMNRKYLLKPLCMAVLFAAAAGLPAQEHKVVYDVAAVDHLGDFFETAPRTKAINAAVAKAQRQNPGISYKAFEYVNHPDMLAIIKAWESTPEDAQVDSLYAVTLTVTSYNERKRYLIFLQFLPFASNPYYYWIYRGSEK